MTVGCIGIRREDKNEWERRVPLTPAHVGELVAKGMQVVVQPSSIRVFRDQEYADAGARVDENLADCHVVVGVKEMPAALFRRDGAYLFFSHTIKGQRCNMPMLRRMMDVRGTLIDYERVTDDSGRRLIFFGRFAGVAGMIDSLWAMGERLRVEGTPSPFEDLRPAHAYASLEEAKAAVRGVGQRIASDGLDRRAAPFVCGITGYGNVSLGAQEILDLLPVESISPERLAATCGTAAQDRHHVYKVVFHEHHMFAHKQREGAFDLHHYFAHPSEYRADFARYLPYLTLLCNCIYWDAAGPRLVTLDDCRALYRDGTPRLRVIGDVSCDIEGSIQCTVKSTNSGSPIYVYEPETGAVRAGARGRGPVVLAVDNLPCELPRESSDFFGDCLMPFMESIARADFRAERDALQLPEAIKRAMITHRGELCAGYEHLQQHIDSAVVS